MGYARRSTYRVDAHTRAAFLPVEVLIRHVWPHAYGVHHFVLDVDSQYGYLGQIPLGVEVEGRRVPRMRVSLCKQRRTEGG
jgi:hypothetical protein